MTRENYLLAKKVYTEFKIVLQKARDWGTVEQSMIDWKRSGLEEIWQRIENKYQNF